MLMVKVILMIIDQKVDALCLMRTTQYIHFLLYIIIRPEGGCAVQGSHKVDIMSHSYLQNTSVLVDFMKKMGPFYEIQM